MSLKKQISMFVDRSDWLAMRAEAARRRISMTELFRRWIAEDLTELRGRFREENASAGANGEQ